MARVSPGIPALNAGEFDGKMASRTDIRKYPFSASRLENYYILPQGGITRRPGTQFISEVRDSAVEARLIPFQFAVDDAFMIEAGPNYFRLFRQDTTPVTVPTIGAAVTNGNFDTDISGWTNSSVGGSSIAHDATTQSLQFNVVSGNVSAAEQEITTTTDSVAHTLSANIRGLAGTVVRFMVGTAQGGSDIHDVELRAGNHVVTFTPNVATFWIRFETTSLLLPGLDSVAFQSNQRFEISTPYDASEVDNLYFTQSADVVYMAVGTQPIYRLERQADLSWSLVRPEFIDGPYDITNADADRTMQPSGTTGAITLTAAGFTPFNAAWVGRQIRILHGTTWGHAVITSITSSTVANAVVREDFGGTTAEDEFAIGAWSDASGWPRIVTFHEQRLVAAGSRTFEQTFWLSQSVDFTNFRPDSLVEGAIQVESDDALDFTISADQVNIIQWMSSGRELVAGTSGGEWTIRSSGSSLTPDDIDVKRQTTHGSARFQPVRVGHTVLFLQRSRRKIREFVFDFGTDAFLSPDLTELAEQVTRSGITRMAYQQEPYNYIHALRDDGQIGTLTYLREQEVVGWSRTILGGAFGSGAAVVESIETLPGAVITGERDQDVLWCIVKRTINGVTRRYVEVFSRIFEGVATELFDNEAEYLTELLDMQKNRTNNSDSSVLYQGAETQTISGLDHLEGQEVSVWSEGAIEGNKTVSGGSITLDLPTTVARVGLPYRHVYRSFKIDFGAQTGTSVAKIKRINNVTFIVDNTGALRAGPKIDLLTQVPLREVNDAMDSAAPLTTGEIRIPFLGFHERDARIHIAGSDPAPHTVLGIVPEMKTQDPV